MQSLPQVSIKRCERSEQKLSFRFYLEEKENTNALRMAIEKDGFSVHGHYIEDYKKAVEDDPLHRHFIEVWFSNPITEEICQCCKHPRGWDRTVNAAC